MTEIIEIDEKCIEDGYAGSCRLCPAALALEQAGYTDVSVGSSLVHMRLSREPNPVIAYEMSESLQDWIAELDSGTATEPTRLYVERDERRIGLAD